MYDGPLGFPDQGSPAAPLILGVGQWVLRSVALPAAVDPVADTLAVVHIADMTAVRSFILEALHRVANGGDMSEGELEAAVPDPFALDKIEKKAWEELSHWADDADIRECDGSYAALKRERMCDHITALQADGS